MSSSTFSLLLILSLLPLLSSAGRPCKTLFISYYTITTTTTTTSSAASVDPTSTDGSQLPTSPLIPTTTRFFAVYRNVPLFPRRNPNPNVHLLDRPVQSNRLAGISPSSIQDRAKDILIVVAGLLFGLGCGAITASTMYLVWSLFAGDVYRHEISDGESDSDLESPKKMGYVKITSAAEPLVAKEGYEGK